MAKAFTIPSIFTAIDKFSGPMTRMNRKLEEFKKTSKGIRLQEIADGAAKVAKTSAVVGLALAAPLALAAREAMKYEDSLASFRTIVSDLSDKDFAKFQGAIEETAKTTKKSYTEVAASFEKIAGLNSKFAETSEGLSAVSTAAITLAKASKADLGESAESLVGIMNQFSLGAMEANRTINVLAAGQAVGAASIKQTAESFVNFGSVAASANLTLEQSTALVQTMGKFSLFGAEAGTKLRGSVLKLQQAGVGYKSGQFKINDALLEAKARIDKLSTAKQKDAALNKIFGAENISTGRILLSNIDTFNEYAKSVTGTTEATKAAEINSKTLSEKLKAAQAQFQNLSIKVGEKLIPVLGKLIDKISPILENIMNWIEANPGLTKTIVVLAGALASFAFIVSTVATAISLWADYQLVLNAAMAANPIGLIIIGVAAAIALVTIIIKKWNEWGAALALFMGPVGMIIGAIQSFRRNWDMITLSFQQGGILAGLKAIGKTLLDVILMPLQQILGIIAKVTGFEWAKNASAGIEKFRAGLGVNTTTDESGDPLPVKEALNPKAVQQDALVEKMESTNNAKVRVDINDPNGRTKASSDNDFVKVRTTSTMPQGAW